MEEQKKQKIGPKTKALLIVMILLIVVLIAAAFIMRIKAEIEFTLLGSNNVIIEVGNEYQEPGFIARCGLKNIDNKVKVTSNLNPNVVGDYKIQYQLKINYLRLSEILFRQVKVVDTTKPELKINSDKEMTVYIGDKYHQPTYSAIDNYDGDITESVKVQSNVNLEKIGTYEINYSVSDSSGNETSDKVIVHVKGKKNPYVVVSISKQTLKYYEYGQVVLSSNIVTGINGKTPTGNFKVLNKATNIILKGKDYESFVNYWIAFKGASFGFHDASWRSKFGGNIYKYNGSHGCVNMPYNKVKQLYNMISIGTPVYIKK